MNPHAHTTVHNSLGKATPKPRCRPVSLLVCVEAQNTLAASLSESKIKGTCKSTVTHSSRQQSMRSRQSVGEWRLAGRRSRNSQSTRNDSVRQLSSTPEGADPLDRAQKSVLSGNSPFTLKQELSASKKSLITSTRLG